MSLTEDDYEAMLDLPHGRGRSCNLCKQKDERITALLAHVRHKDGCNALRCMKCGCPVEPINQHLVWIGGNDRLDHAVERGTCTCGLSALTEQPK